MHFMGQLHLLAIPVPHDFYVCINPLWKYSVCFSVQIPAAAASLLSLWSHTSHVLRTFLPGALSTPELRGSRWCSAPCLRAQGGMAEVCRLPGLGDVHGGLADPSHRPMVLPHLLLHVATLGVSTPKSQAREINQEKTNYWKTERIFWQVMCSEKFTEAEEHQLWYEGQKRELGAAVNPNSTP